MQIPEGGFCHAHSRTVGPIAGSLSRLMAYTGRQPAVHQPACYGVYFTLLAALPEFEIASLHRPA
jgi:hypothetical protein